MRKIADRVDYSHPALYAYFPTKDALLLELLREGLRLFRDDLAAARDETRSAEENVIAVGVAFWDFAWRHPELYQVMHGLDGVAFATADVAAEGRRAGEPAVAAIAALLTERGLDPADAERKTDLLWGAIHGLVSLTMAGRFSRDEGAALAAEAVGDALAGWGCSAPIVAVDRARGGMASGSARADQAGQSDREETAMTSPTGIDTAAPVISRHRIEIDAPLAVVWGLHTDVLAWSSWNPDIADVAAPRPLAPGAAFGWRTAGLAIRSTVYALTAPTRILWGGDASGITGIHEWRFAETAGGVRVETEESWSGAPVEADAAALQAGLDRSLVSWLRHLKAAAEAKG